MFHTQATNWTLDKINANTKQRFFKTHANLKDLPCGKAPGVKVCAYTLSFTWLLKLLCRRYFGGGTRILLSRVDASLSDLSYPEATPWSRLFR